MRAVLMAGGSGTRLRPLTCELPKPMVPLLNRPIAEHILNLLRRHQLTEVIITLHYLPDVVREYFGDGHEFGVDITYAVEEDYPLGTAGCVKNIASLLTETFFVVSGDSVTDFDLTAALAFHRQHQAPATLVLTSVSNPKEFGVVITDEQGRISRFLEKPSPGEIFSDTVNTGIYILEPEVLDYLPSGIERDFSKDLFPLLLQSQIPLYGYVAQGYWCDVGSLETYQQVQYDALQERVKLEPVGRELYPQIWVGHNSIIHPRAILRPPLLIGHNCRVQGDVCLESGTVLGDNVIIGSRSHLNQAIVWGGSVIGEEGVLDSCIIGRRVRVDRHAIVQEGAVIGSRTRIGEESVIGRGVRIWPGKQIEAGARVNQSLIWGSTGQRNLFGYQGVAGLANVDITPEFAVRLAAAYASTLEPGTSVLISRDQRSVSRMIANALIAGLMSVGINVLCLEAIALPISRFAVQSLSVCGGIHVRLHPDRDEQLLIEFFDHKGINLNQTKQRQIETAYFREDMRRVSFTDVGRITYPSQIVEIYAQGFGKWLNTQALQQYECKIVLDYAYAVSGAVLPELLNKFGSDVVVLNATVHQTPPNTEERQGLLQELGQVVQAIQANLGVQVSANGERLTLVDDRGQTIVGEELTALMADLVLSAYPGGTVIIPVHISSAIEVIARKHGGSVMRTRANPTDLMEACQKQVGAVLGGSAETGFIFPQLHPGYDAMFSIAKLMEMLALRQQPLSEIRQNLPQVFHTHQALRCPWIAKGSLMRHLVETHSPTTLNLVDGVKILHRDGNDWVLVLPDASEPLVHLFVNGREQAWTEQMNHDYRQRIHEFAHLEPSEIGV
ncbi:mannose-1-phosphate guanyltransferase [Synechococcus sp. PCC 6312]|uniref:mannose-1-phosphate guanyltransferase n=1 Tax=Synechococcus sp. (strain ATCC 27167 / PCC 6312) TaxID=195253 RepID=UPI00029EEE7D|nr:mannose-1-phosphate guanyltransferase [Synechococcus sp. PCC 6312]AFY61621.1 Nucleoside-diphosphate-sugar pyrophosphorylase family protein [Synechococcus sp. PCC 6312]